MNADQLLKHFDRISEAPDAVARLRRFVLDLAVRGKLVEQDAGDEPAEELLKRIEAEKVRLVNEGKIRKFKALPPIDEGDARFDIPASWVWVRLIELLTKLTDGTHHSPPNSDAGEFKYITAKNIKAEGVSLDNVTYVSGKIHEEIYSRCNPEKGDVLFIKDGATTGVVTINDLDEPFSMLSSVALLKPAVAVANSLIVLFLRSPFFYEQMRNLMKGAAITRVTLKRMSPALVPLPPLAEQHRIVAKVDELMAVCDELEQAQTTRENRRDRLVAATLHRLNNPDTLPESGPTFKQTAGFYLNHLPRLTTKPEHIQQLRQTILNLAVRGKLVPQDPVDEPAGELLGRIGAEKALLQGLGKGKIGQIPELVGERDAPFSLPGSWRWVRVSDVAVSRLGKMLDKAKNKGSHRRYLRNVNVRWFDFDLSDLLEMRFEEDELEKFALKSGDVLVCEGGEPGRAAVWDCRATDVYFQKAIHRVSLLGGIVPIYFARALYHDAVTGRLEQYFTGVTIKHLTGKGLAGYSFPLPPVAEQHRILARIDEMFAACNKLEAKQTAAAANIGQLLETVVQEAI